MRDGGTLQIGIGEDGDAPAQALILRHRDNARFATSWRGSRRRTRIAGASRRGSFDKGLYGVSEMFVDAFLELMEAGILKREVDGALLHGAFFLGPKSSIGACARWRPNSSRESA